MENVIPNGVDSCPVRSSTRLASTCPPDREAKELTAGKTFSPGINRLAPLQGKKVFMHYEPGTNANKRVETILRRLKAELVDFFGRDVNYVITNRPLGKSTESPLHSPSDFAAKGNTPKAVVLSAKQKNQKGIVSEELKTPRLSGGRPPTPAVTRGRAMLLAARNSTPTLKEAFRDASPVDAVPSSVLRQLQPSNMSNSRLAPGMAAPRLSLNSVMLNGSLEVKTSPNDLLVRARNLGIKILTIDMVVKWIRNLPSDVQSYIESAQRVDSEETRADIAEDPERDRVCQVRQLKPPCIKVLDVKSRSRPLYLDHTDYLPSLWARPRLKTRISIESGDNSPSNTATGQNTPLCSGSVPAASLGCAPTHHPPSQPPGGGGGTGTTVPSVLSRQNSRSKRKDRLVKRSNKCGAPVLHRSASVSKVSDVNRSKPLAEDEPSGYCECCSINYANLFEHLHCEEHQQFATNGENYRLLDDVLNKLPSIQMFLAQESDATKDRLSEKSSERKRHRSRQSNGSVTTSKGRQTIGSVKPTAALQSNESPAPFFQSPTPVPTEQPSNTNFPCPPPLSLPEFDKLGGGSAIGVGHGQQKQLFSDDEDSNPACNPSVALSADEDNVRMVTDAVAEAILAIPFEEQSNQALKHVADLSEPALGVEEPAESDQVETIVPISKHPEMAVPERFDLQPLPHDPKPESQPEQHLVDAWHTLCDDVYIHQNLEKSQAACLSSCSPAESPVLERYHHTCQYCSRAHIPSIPLSCQLQMHCLLGPIHNWERLGCQGFTSPLSLSTNCSAEGSSCDVDYNEAATAAAALILSEQLRDDLSQRSRVEKTVAANKLYITPPHSPVFDQIDNCSSLGDTKPTQPCFTPSSPPLSPFCTATFAGKPCFLSPVIAPPLHNPTSAYKSAFLSPVSEKCPPQFVSTPVGSPKHHLQLYDVPLDLTDSFCASPSSTHSDSDIQRKLSVHKLDSTSFECILPTDPAEFKARPKADQGRLPKLSSCRRRQSHQSRSLSECNGLDQLPVVRRPKLSAKPVARQGKKTPRVANCTNPRAKNIVQSVRHKRSIPLTDLTPTRFQTPRTAAKVARESISLSVRALFSPSGMDRCFESPCPLIYAAGLSRVPVTPEFYTSTPPTPGRRIKHTLCTINLTPSKGSIRTHGRTLFPERVTT